MFKEKIHPRNDLYWADYLYDLQRALQSYFKLNKKWSHIEVMVQVGENKTMFFPSMRIMKDGVPIFCLEKIESPVLFNEEHKKHWLEVGVLQYLFYDPTWYVNGNGRRLFWNYIKTGEEFEVKPLRHPAHVFIEPFHFWLCHHKESQLIAYAQNGENFPSEAFQLNHK